MFNELSTNFLRPQTRNVARFLENVKYVANSSPSMVCHKHHWQGALEALKVQVSQTVQKLESLQGAGKPLKPLKRKHCMEQEKMKQDGVQIKQEGVQIKQEDVQIKQEIVEIEPGWCSDQAGAR